MIKEDGTVIHFNNPKVQASVPANTFSVTGSAENKRKRVAFSFIFRSTVKFSHVLIYFMTLVIFFIALSSRRILDEIGFRDH